MAQQCDTRHVLHCTENGSELGSAAVINYDDVLDRAFRMAVNRGNQVWQRFGRPVRGDHENRFWRVVFEAVACLTISEILAPEHWCQVDHCAIRLVKLYGTPAREEDEPTSEYMRDAK